MVSFPVELFPGTVIRLADLQDLDCIVGLTQQKPEPGRLTTPAVLSNRILNETCLVIEQQSTITACCMCVIRDRKCEVVSLVATNAASALLQRAITPMVEWLKEQGVFAVISRCRKELFPIYKRCGFKEIGTLPNFFGPNVDAIAIEISI